jgi:hypothetical protein
LQPCPLQQQGKKQPKNKKTCNKFANNFLTFFAFLAFQLLQVIMQIRFATMGTKNKHERNPKKSTEKVWNPKKGKNHKTKKTNLQTRFLGLFFAFKCFR